MTVIDLLNKIANGEEVPKKVWFDGRLYEYEEECNMAYRYKYRGLDCTLGLFGMIDNFNDEIEIIEEVEDKEYEDIKELSYKYVNTYGNVSQHRKSEEPLIDTINALIRNQKYILERLESGCYDKQSDNS